MVQYGAISSPISRDYRPLEYEVKQPVDYLNRGDIVLCLAVMPHEMLIITKQMKVGWVVISSHFKEIVG